MDKLEHLEWVNGELVSMSGWVLSEEVLPSLHSRLLAERVLLLNVSGVDLSVVVNDLTEGSMRFFDGREHDTVVVVLVADLNAEGDAVDVTRFRFEQVKHDTSLVFEL